MAVNSRYWAARKISRRVINMASWLFLLIIIIGISYVILLPLLTKISSSLMMEVDLYDRGVKWIPRNITFENYRLAWSSMQYPIALMNSLGLAAIVSIAQLVSCTLVGYGFARFDFRGKNLCFGLVVLTLVVPPQVIMTPLYLNFRYFNFLGLLPAELNLLNTIYPILVLSLTATGFKNGLFIYILRQFFGGMPKELEEAAYVDGAGMLRTFFLIMVPGAIPSLVVVFLFAFVWQWNDYFYTTLFMSGATLLPVTLETVAVRSVEILKMSDGTIAADVLATPQFMSIVDNAGMLLFIAPLLLIYAFMQRYFIESIERTGIVG